MTNRRGCLPILVILLLSGAAFMGVRFYGGKFIDRFQRPWAYSTTEPLLVGTWRGTFRDPNGMTKTLTLQIDLPETDDERWDRAGRRTRSKKRGRNKRVFDGVATVTGPRGQEPYTLYGRVNDDDWHRLETIQFSTPDGQQTMRQNFNLHSAVAGGQWTTDRMTLRLAFTYTTPTGSAFWNSADPRYEHKAALTLTRTNP